ncbi:hypothetical protein QJQ45_001447 [Haematococcus lacustris]|nr:hypothetical protein QJQ45_001447 [Haematococcus lacustris]
MAFSVSTRCPHPKLGQSVHWLASGPPSSLVGQTRRRPLFAPQVAAIERALTPRGDDQLDRALHTVADFLDEGTEVLETAHTQPLVCEGPVFQLPLDVAAHLGSMLTTTSSWRQAASRFCVNCHTPSTDKECPVCGHEPKAEAVLLGSDAMLQFNQHMQQQKKQIAAKQQGRLRQNASSNVALSFDENMLLHRGSLPPCPERPERLQAILTRLEAMGLTSRCRIMPAREATQQELKAVHSPGLLQALSAASALAAAATAPAHDSSSGGSAKGRAWRGKSTAISPALLTAHATSSTSSGDAVLYPDSLCNAHTYKAACLAAGSSAAMAEAVFLGHMDAGLAVVRPPGHHATYNTAQSGCYLNNAAIAARAAQAAGAQRVMIVDWDIHHGQGTQEIFEEDTSVLFVSMHRADEEYYPGSGMVTDVGVGDGEGYTVNIPWSDNSIQDSDLLQALMHVVLPIAYEFQPELVIVSAGFDAAHGDPLGGCSISPACFAQMTHLLKGLAPTMLLLEGGYNLDATARCVEACLRVLLGERPPPLAGAWQMSKAGTVAVMNAMQMQSEFWPSVRPWSLNGWMGAIKEQQEAQQDNAQQQDSPQPAAKPAQEKSEEGVDHSGNGAVATQPNLQGAAQGAAASIALPGAGGMDHALQAALTAGSAALLPTPSNSKPRAAALETW